MPKAKKEVPVTETLSKFVDALEAKFLAEVKKATNALKKSTKGQSDEDLTKTLKEFGKALKDRASVEIDKATEKLNEGLKKKK